MYFIFQGNTSAIDSHLFDLLEAGQDWTEICELRTKVIGQSSSLWIARPENWRGNWSPQNFQSPSLQTHASNEFYCVRRKSVKLFWMKSFKFEWLILWKSTNANCHMILYILALKETLWMKNKEHCPYPTTTIPLWEKEMSQKILKSNSTRGAISTENFDTKEETNFT